MAVRPSWALAGRSALGVLYAQPVTDLDLAWHELPRLGPLSREVLHRLSEAGLAVTRLQDDDALLFLAVEENGETCRLRLTAERGPFLEPPRLAVVGELTIQVESPQEVFADRLCNLLDRPDLQDLEDVQKLIQNGACLEKALLDAPAKLAELSPLLLAWSLKRFKVSRLLLDSDRARTMKSFKHRLILEILDGCFPSALVS
jgi:hypothetical protein